MDGTRMEIHRYRIKEVTTGTSNGKRPRGRPRQRWTEIVKSDLEKCAPGLKLEEIKARERWREIVEAAKALLNGL